MIIKYLSILINQLNKLMREVYYIKLNYDPQLFKSLKKISLYFVLLVTVYLFNAYKLKMETFFNALYDIIIYLLIYSHVFEPNKGDFGTTKEKIAFAFMAESLIISYQDFYYRKTNFFFYERNIKVSIAPNMFSLIISISYNFSLMVRNNIRLGDKPKDLVLHIMNIIFFSTLISVFISNNYFYIPIYGETNFTAQTFGFFLVILSWISIKSINLIIYPLLAFLSMYRLGEVNKALGNAGICYLLCSYISLYLQFFSGGKKSEGSNYFLNEFYSDIFYQNKPISNTAFNENYPNHESEERIRQKIKREKIKAISPSNQVGLKILNIKNGKNIKLILKKMDKKTYEININEAEKIIKLKQEFKKIDESYKNMNLVFVWKGKCLDDNEYICSYGIKNEDIIIFLMRNY